ncbi:TonB-dependent receptor [Sphingosinicella xenopeptidilytica]|uniref:TonB-dependent receptor n=1 Tax=Sphingosinicella xenopeptidilytica TaxID=364098 RepID=A0ABW3C0B5_SPHXN
MRLEQHVIGGLLASTAIVLSVPTYAQEAPASDYVLEEIVVTAQKRSESLQRVPVSISAFTPAKLEQQQIEGAAQLQIAVPGLVYSSSGGFATPYIRGIGSDIATVGAEPGVATYVDGVYVSSPLSVNMDILDVERVEVVKGPQGTLYGRNAIGGAINIITREPGQELEGRIVAGYGNHNRREVGFYASGPVSETLAAGAYVNYLGRDSLVENLAINPIGGSPQDKENISVRLKTVFTPTDTAKFVLSGEYGKNEAYDVWSFRQVQDNALGLLAGGNTGAKPRQVYHNYPSFQKGRLWASTLRGEIETSFAQLVSITAYRNYRAVSSVDYDGTDAQIIGFAIDPSFSRQFSQEVQLVSLPSSPVKWIVGGYYFDEKTGGQIVLNPGDALVVLKPRLPVTSYAAFGELTVPVTDKLNVTGGLRYTHEKKSISSALGGDPDIPLPAQSTTFNKVTWKAAANYQFTPDVMAYASYSRGFQSGAFNATDSGAPPVDPEILDAYEVGLKSEFLDRRLQINAAAFYYDFQDLQVQVNDSVGGAAASFQNAGAARVKGAELSVVALPVAGLQLDASVSYLKSKYLDFPNYAGFARDDVNGGNAPVTVDVSGNSVIRAPKWSLSAGATYGFDVGSGRIEFNGAYYYNDGFSFDPQHLVLQKSYSLVNASVSWLPTDALRVSIWGQNLTNEHYLTFGVASNYGTTNADAPGRLYGVRMSYSF